MGWQVDPDNPTQIRRDTVSALSPEAIENQTAAPEATTKAYMTGNIVSTDENLTSGDGVTTTVSIYDNLGYSYSVKLKITENGQDGKYDVNVVSIKDENNKDIDLNNNEYDYKIDGNTTMAFDTATGAFIGVDDGAGGNLKSIKLAITPKNGSGDVFSSEIEIDCSSLHMYSSKSGQSSVETHRGSTSSATDGAGRKVGTLTDVSIDTQGMIYGVYDNGVNKLLGQIAVANFVNPAGLESVGNNLYQETTASGEFDGIGQTIADSGETITQGVLEMSNVDLSQEFTDMIVTQRGFQANSRIITVSDTLLEELINLKR
jgi:flagellar hook protein FlgE